MLGIAIKQAIQSHLGDYPIRWHGDTAEVCQKKVQLPALVDSIDYPQSVYRQMLGYGLHELGHIRYTDEAPWDWAIENHSRYLGRLINGLEDVRIEKAMILAGADQSFFENTINAALWDGYVKADEQKNIPFILAVEGRRLNGYCLHCQSILDETPWSKELWWALKQGRTAKSTGAVVSIALRLYRRLQKGGVIPNCQAQHIAKLAKEERMMSQLFCKVGDLAVTVEAELPINLGNVVKIVSAAGHKKFSSYQQIFLWNVEVASPDRPLVYEYPNGKLEQCLTGRIPDRYLRPIRPDELEWVLEQEHTTPVPKREAKEVDYV